MAKIRIYELAQRLGLGNKDLLKRLRDKGVEAKSHMSVIDEETVKEFGLLHRHLFHPQKCDRCGWYMRVVQ